MKSALRIPALVLVLSCLASCRYDDGGAFALQPYVDGGGDVLDIQGDQVGVFKLRRGSIFLTGTTWKWEAISSFDITTVPHTPPDVMQVEVRIKSPKPQFPVSEQGFVREYGPNKKPIIVKQTGQQLQAPFTINWK